MKTIKVKRNLFSHGLAGAIASTLQSVLFYPLENLRIK